MPITLKDPPKSGIDIRVWPEAKRVFLKGPVPSSTFAGSHPIFKMMLAICGKDAIAVGDIGSYLGGFAFCARGGAEAWRSDLGLPAWKAEGP
jgi:hypothetical protein